MHGCNLEWLTSDIVNIVVIWSGVLIIQTIIVTTQECHLECIVATYSDIVIARNDMDATTDHIVVN